MSRFSDIDPATADREDLLKLLEELSEVLPGVAILRSPRLLALMPLEKLRAIVVNHYAAMLDSIG